MFESMSQHQSTWTHFELKIRILSPQEKIYNAWAFGNGICSWFLDTAEFQDAEGIPRNLSENIEKGDSFVWKWCNNDFKLSGRVIEADGEGNYAFTFIEPCVVRIHLEAHEEGTVITLTEENIPDDDEHRYSRHLSDKVKWTFWLTQLKAWLEHGIKLNETHQSMQMFGSDLVVNQ